MSGRISSRDYERLCAYLDGQLPPHERGQMAHELHKRPDLQRELEQLRRTRQVLRSVPMHKVPHNFILTRAMAAARRSPLILPIFQFASALSTLAVVVLLVLDLSMGTLFQSASAANAPLAAVRSAAAAATETPAPQIIEWNNTGSGGGSAATGLGGGYGGGPSVANSSMAVSTETTGVATDMTQKMATPPAPEQPMLSVPQAQATPQPEATQAPSFSAQSGNDNPILGIPPANQQGKIIVSPTATPTSAPESVVTEVFPFRRIIELGLALLAVGTAIAALFLRRQR
jgi:hypothetical protein